MERNKSKNGITLIALIITIIVMLILVAVSVQIVINSGLFDSAKTAAKKTEEAYRAEAAEGSKVNIDGEEYNSLVEYMENSCTHKWGEWQTVTESTCTIVGSKERKCTICNKNEVKAIPILEHTYGEWRTTKPATCTEVGSKTRECSICGKESTEEIAIDETAHNYKNYICTICGAEDPNKPVPVVEGDYIKYDVAYTDVYMNSYNYTATNGWRLLHATSNGDGTYKDVELISTGIPAKFYYQYQNVGTWWVTNLSKLTEFKTLLGGSSYNFYNNGAECANLKAGAGFYYNFGGLPFAQVSGTISANNGGYTAITNSDQKSGTTAGTGAGLFLTSKASGVRILTLKELNEARGITNDPDNTETITAVQDPIGLYYLGNLKIVQGIGSTSYERGWYWLASPLPGYPSNMTNVGYGGDMKGTAGGAVGVRTVVKISRF